MCHWFVWLQLEVFDSLCWCTIFYTCNRARVQKIYCLCDTTLWRSYPQSSNYHRFAALSHTRRFCFIRKPYCIEIGIITRWSHSLYSHQLGPQVRTWPEPTFNQIYRWLFEVYFTDISKIVQLSTFHFLPVTNASCLHNESCCIF